MSFSIVFHADNEHTHTHREHENSLKYFWASDSCQLDHTLWVVQEYRQKHQSKDPAVLESIQPPLPLWELEFILATVFYSGVSLSLVSGNCLVIHRVENDSICNYDCNYIYIRLCTHTDSNKHRETSWLMGWVFSPAQGAEAHSSVNVEVACLILLKHNDPILRTKYTKGDNYCSILLWVKFNNLIVWPLQYCSHLEAAWGSHNNAAGKNWHWSTDCNRCCASL